MTTNRAGRRTATTRIARHITALHTKGMTTRYIARAAHTCEKTIWAIANGQQKYVYASTAARILAVREDLDGGRHVPAVGAVRRMQAMISEGWPQAHLARQLGWTTNQIYRLLTGTRTHITRDSAALVDALYEATDSRPAPAGKVATQSRRYAQARGWHPRDAWYADTIDDPAAPPYFTGHATDDLVDDIRVQRAAAGNPAAVAQLNPAEKVEATRLLLRRGVTAGAINRYLAVSGQTARKLVAAALEDVAA